MALRDELRRAVEPLGDRALGVLLWGSHAEGSATPRSDVDLCIVAGPDGDPDALLRAAWRHVHVPGRDLDIRVFENLPMFLKAAVLEDHEVLATPDEPALYEHLYRFRKRWADQAHRQRVTEEEVRTMLRRKARR